jgi:hypothetical protein
VAEAQRLRCDDDRLGRRRLRLVLRFERLHSLLSLAVEPGLRDENREQAEHDGKRDHHDGANAHGTIPYN